MDIKINNTNGKDQYLEYNTLGGVLDFYFMAGPTPVAVSQQYAEIVGLPAMQSYWAFGFHNCRYGYQDAYAVAEAVYNYSKAGIPLETMWTVSFPFKFNLIIVREVILTRDLGH
jgi:alpha-glucosidase